MLNRYRETNQRDPSRIIFYRDGVGEGQIQYVKETEVEAIKSVFKDQGLSPQLAFIVVSKRISNKYDLELAQAFALDLSDNRRRVLNSNCGKSLIHGFCFVYST